MTLTASIKHAEKLVEATTKLRNIAIKLLDELIEQQEQEKQNEK